MSQLPTMNAPVGQIPHGVADYFWDEAFRRRSLEQVLLACFRRWGYADVIPPSFEYADTLSARGSKELQAELCRFLDRDGSTLALRADMTIAVARLVGTRLHDWPMPQRFCYAGSVFRDAEARAGQQREFWQAGVELIGSAAPEADAEVLALTAYTLEAAGLRDYRIVIGQMQYFEGLLAALQLDLGQRWQLQQAVDRNSEAELATVLSESALPRRQYRAVAALPELSGPRLEELLARAAHLSLNETMLNAVRNLQAIVKALDAYGLLPHISLDLTEIHNLGYYTGITFEVLAPGIGYRLASGGRYDNLVGSFGAPQPAVGVAFGVERLLLALDHSQSRPPTPSIPDVIVATNNDPECLRFVERLRDQGLRVAIDLGANHGLALWESASQQGVMQVIDCQAGAYYHYTKLPTQDKVEVQATTPDALLRQLSAPVTLARGAATPAGDAPR